VCLGVEIGLQLVRGLNAHGAVVVFENFCIACEDARPGTDHRMLHCNRPDARLADVIDRLGWLALEDADKFGAAGLCVPKN
jgi:hypothetical protein